MKKYVIIPLILIIFTCIACDTKQKGPSHLTVGRKSLIVSGNAIEAVNTLVEAEKREEDKSEPRALLIIAYSYGLSQGTAKAQRVEAEYRKQRSERIAALNEAEMEKMLEILSERSVVQKDGFQALVEKGTDAAAILVKYYANATYPLIQKDIISTIEKIGSDAIDPLFEKIIDPQTSPTVKMNLIQVIGEIGDKKAIEKLNALDTTDYNDALKLTLYTTLYRLGESKHKSKILAGLTADEVEVRRAAAMAMSNLKNINTSGLITALNDTDSQVVADVVKSLAVHKTTAAVKPLINIFKTEHEQIAKKAVVSTLQSYAETGGELSKGWAGDLCFMIIDKEVTLPQDRLHILQILSHPTLVKRLKAVSKFRDIDTKLYDYLQTAEDSDSVKTGINNLLNSIRR